MLEIRKMRMYYNDTSYQNFQGDQRPNKVKFHSVALEVEECIDSVCYNKKQQQYTVKLTRK